MLKSTNDVIDFSINATDGSIGRVEEFYFDEDHWTVRYVVVNTGGWFFERKVLISPLVVERIDLNARTIDTPLTREEVRNSPPIAPGRAILRAHEAAYNDHYGFPDYWDGPMLWGAKQTPKEIHRGAERKSGQDGSGAAQSRLRGTRRITGYHIAAQDGAIGHADDFLFDDESWAIRYLVVDTRNWWPGKKVLLSPLWISNVDWHTRKIAVGLARQEIRNSPEYDDTRQVEPEYESQLQNYYGRIGRRTRHADGASQAVEQTAEGWNF